MASELRTYDYSDVSETTEQLKIEADKNGKRSQTHTRTYTFGKNHKYEGMRIHFDRNNKKDGVLDEWIFIICRYGCEYCPQLFLFKDSRDNHENLAHENEEKTDNDEQQS